MDEEEPYDFSYDAKVGAISVSWNRLEIRMDRLIFQYIHEESDLIARMLAAMGNVSKGDLLLYLADNRELNESIKGHISGFVKAFNTLRENRNILQHSVPNLRRDDKYMGTTLKLSRFGLVQEFDASEDVLDDCHDEILRWMHFGQLLGAAINKNDPDAEIVGVPFHKLVASLDTPLQPRKLTPLPPLEDLTDD